MVDATRDASVSAGMVYPKGLARARVELLMADCGRPPDNLHEVALWADMLRVQGAELFYANVGDNQAIAIPETTDAIRALTGIVKNAHESTTKTNNALGIEAVFV